MFFFFPTTNTAKQTFVHYLQKKTDNLCTPYDIICQDWHGIAADSKADVNNLKSAQDFFTSISVFMGFKIPAL